MPRTLVVCPYSRPSPHGFTGFQYVVTIRPCESTSCHPGSGAPTRSAYRIASVFVVHQANRRYPSASIRVKSVFIVLSVSRGLLLTTQYPPRNPEVNRKVSATVAKSVSTTAVYARSAKSDSRSRRTRRLGPSGRHHQPHIVPGSLRLAERRASGVGDASLPWSSRVTSHRRRSSGHSRRTGETGYNNGGHRRYDTTSHLLESGQPKLSTLHDARPKHHLARRIVHNPGFVRGQSKANIRCRLLGSDP